MPSQCSQRPLWPAEADTCRGVAAAKSAAESRDPSIRLGGGFPLEQRLPIFGRGPDTFPERLEVNGLSEKTGRPRLGLASGRSRSIKRTDNEDRDISGRRLSRQDFTDHEAVQVRQH